MSTSLTGRVLRPFALAAALTLGAVVPPAVPVATAATATTAATAAVDCRTTWGSLVKRQSAAATGEVTGVRSGRHRCFDRLVVDVGTGEQRPGFRVEYVDAVHQVGSGDPVPLRGSAKLRVVLVAPAYDDRGAATYVPADPREVVDVSGYDTFRQAAWAGTFEGSTTVGLGVRARLPVRVFTLTGADGGHRVVVDVAHRW